MGVICDITEGSWIFSGPRRGGPPGLPYPKLVPTHGGTCGFVREAVYVGTAESGSGESPPQIDTSIHALSLGVVFLDG